MPNTKHSLKLSVVITNPDGKLDKSRHVVWICTVCGKKGANRMQSCYDHAVPVYADTVRCDASGVYATRAPEPKEQVIDPAWVYRPG